MIFFKILIVAAGAFAFLPIKASTQPAQLDSPVGANFPKGKELDVAGLYPGMTVGQAETTLKGNLKERQFYYFALNFAGTLKIDPPAPSFIWLAGNGGSRDVRNWPRDEQTVWFSGPPVSTVVAITRELRFSPGQAPETAEVIENLTRKYGGPSSLPPGDKIQTARSSITMEWHYRPDSKVTTDSCRMIPNYYSFTVFFRKIAPQFDERSIARDNYNQIWANTGARSRCGILARATIRNSEAARRTASISLLMMDYSRMHHAIQVARRGAAEAEASRLKRLQDAPKAPAPKF